MAMNFEALVDEVNDRGFGFPSDTRVGRWVNQSYQQICNAGSWPFLETTTTGTAPLTVSDLRAVLTVRNTTQGNILRWIDRRQLLQSVSTDLTTTANPSYWYQEARTIIKVYPANTSDTLSVHYLKIPAALTGTDAHVIPDEFEDLIIDGAVIRAYKDVDNFDKAAGLQQFYDRDLAQMKDALLSRHHDTHGYVIQSQTYEISGDY